MAANAIENLVRWNLQIVLLVLVAAVLLHLLRVNAPVIRHAFWRVVLATCLVLPLVQPWRATAVTSRPQGTVLAAPAVPVAGPTSSAPGVQGSLFARMSRHLRANGMAYLATILGGGAGLRLLWLLIGIHRLQRLRRAGEHAEEGESYDELAALIEAGAEIRRVARLGQPVTFGVLKPAVLLPASFASLPEGVRRAILAHELWHVRRRDWAWVLLEEAIRAAFWFNPAMWWLISRVQATREEVVDQLTVQLTNAKHTYLEALLAFADQPTLFPATPFARRRHLFHRMLLISREAVMSSRRIVASSIAMVAVLLTAGLYASSAFPLRAAPPSSAAAAAQGPPRDRRPGTAGPETAREQELKKSIAAKPTSGELYLQLARLQEARLAVAEAEGTLLELQRSVPDSPALPMVLATFYLRTGQFDRGVGVLEAAGALNPQNPRIQQVASTFYWEKAFKDQALSPAERLRYVDAGIASTDRVLSNNADYVEALVYKNLFLRMKASLESDPAASQTLIAEADALRGRANALNAGKARQVGQNGMEFVPAPGQGAPPPPPPPPPPPGDFADGQTPVRVGGPIKPPVKLRDVKPIYPPVAFAAQVQGVVIMEATIDPLGNIISASVLRGVPLLDQAALDAVRQWQFAPTIVNGVAVPVIMVVTVNFTMQ